MRDTAEVLESHLGFRRSGDLEADLSENYAEEVVVMSAEGTHVGHDAIRATAGVLSTYAAEGLYHYGRLQEHGPFGMLHWSGTGAAPRILIGADSYYVQDGLIMAQTIFFLTREAMLEQLRSPSDTWYHNPDHDPGTSLTAGPGPNE